MQERLPLEHGGELIADTFEQFLDGGGVAQKGDGHLETSQWDITLSGEDVVGNPFYKVGRVLVPNILHLLFDFLHGYLAMEDGGDLEGIR